MRGAAAGQVADAGGGCKPPVAACSDLPVHINTGPAVCLPVHCIGVRARPRANPVQQLPNFACLCGPAQHCALQPAPKPPTARGACLAAPVPQGCAPALFSAVLRVYIQGPCHGAGCPEAHSIWQLGTRQLLGVRRTESQSSCWYACCRYAAGLAVRAWLRHAAPCSGPCG